MANPHLRRLLQAGLQAVKKIKLDLDRRTSGGSTIALHTLLKVSRNPLTELPELFCPSAKPRTQAIYTTPIPAQPPYLIQREYRPLLLDGKRSPRHFDDAETDAILASQARPLSIIIPVYNEPEHLSRCIDSVIQYSNGRYELLIIDDASTDPAIRPLLAHYSELANVRVLENPSNIGFVRTANIGFKHAIGDVLLLNSDTIVTPRWIEKLRACCYFSEHTATASPFSNAAGAFSVPDVGVNAPLPAHLGVEAYSRLVETVARLHYPEVPTNNGFCMYVKEAALKEAGGFDEQAFGMGYGEENDFCMKLRALGWTHRLATNTFVYHFGSASFSDQKQKLVDEGRKVLNERYPDYTGLVQSFVTNSDLSNARTVIRDAIVNPSIVAHAQKKNFLYVVHIGGGGVPNTNRDLMAQVQKGHNVYLVTSNAKALQVTQVLEDGSRELYYLKLQESWHPLTFRVAECRKFFLSVFLDLGIDLVHIRHLFKFTLDIVDVIKALHVPLIISLHDFYMLSPSISLLSPEGVYEPDVLPVPWACLTPFLEGLTPDKHTQEIWTEQFSQVLESADILVTTSASTKDIACRLQPSLRTKRFEVIEHGRDLEAATDVHYTAHRSASDASLRFLILGNMGTHKGSELLARIASDPRASNWQFHFAGEADEHTAKLGIQHGMYERDQLKGIIERAQPHFSLVLSTWPETFSHTLTESWAHGIPVIASDLGAVGERTTRLGLGWCVNTNSTDDFFDLLASLRAQPEKYQQCLQSLEGFSSRTSWQMAYDYLNLYRSLLNSAETNHIGLLTSDTDELTCVHNQLCGTINAYAREHKNDLIHLLNRVPSNELGSYVSRYGISKVIAHNGANSDDSTHHIAPAKQLDPLLWLTPQPSYAHARRRNLIKVLIADFSGESTNLSFLKAAFLDAKQRLRIEHNIGMSLHVLGQNQEHCNWYELIQPSGSEPSYSHNVAWLKEYSDFDFAIAPHRDMPEGAGTHCKYLEYAALGLAAIYSKSQYSEIILHGENGLLVNNDAEAWADALVHMASDPDARRAMASRAKNALLANHLLG